MLGASLVTRTLLSAATGVAFVSGPATAGARAAEVQDGPAPVTITQGSSTEATTTTLKLSFPHGDRTRLTKAVGSLLHSGGTGQPTVSPDVSVDAQLNCNQEYKFTDPDGSFTYQHRCGGSTSPWGFQISPEVRAIIVGPVDEHGIVWELNGTPQGDQASHTVPADYPFHGTFNPLRDGDHITYIDHYTFTVEIDGQTGEADLTVDGQIHQLGVPPGTPVTGLGAMFTNYGDNATCADWSGGDATNSVVLPDGNRVWFFSDTYLNNGAARKSLWYASAIHNSIVVQSGSRLVRTITGGNTCQEQNQSRSFWDRYAKTPAEAPDGSTGGFYWTGDQMLVGSNVVKFYYHGFPVTLPSGGHSFGIDYPAVASIPVAALENDSVLNINPVRFGCGPAGIIWGSALLDWQGSVYVYGWASGGSAQHGIYLARTSAARLTSPGSWQLYDGLSGGDPVWAGCGTSPTPLAINGVTASSVSYINGTLWLVQFDYTNGQLNAEGPIAAHPSTTPWGFDDNSIALYNPPEGLSVTYPYYYQVYEARIQPGLGSAGNIAISYNVNTSAVDTGCVSANAHDTSIYRPRFIEVPVSTFDPSFATPHARTNAAPAAGAAGRLQAGTTPLAGRPNSWPPTGAPASGTTARTSGTTAQTRAGAADVTPFATAIDGVSDWFDGIGGLCPPVGAPSAPTVGVAPDGVVTLRWPGVGTDVWYYLYFCDSTVADCSTVGTTSPWVGAWSTPQGDLWSPVSAAAIDPVGTTSLGGTDTSGHTFVFYVHSFGAGNSSTGGDSPTTSQVVRVQPPSAPTGLTATLTGGGSSTTYTLSWQQVTYPSTSVFYSVNYCDAAANRCDPASSIGWTSQTPQLGTTATVTFPSGYEFCVRASNLGGVSPCSNVVP